MKPKVMHSYLTNFFVTIFAAMFIATLPPTYPGLTFALYCVTIMFVGYVYGQTSKARVIDRIEYEITQHRKGRNYYGR